MLITSTHNSTYKHIKSLTSKKGRTQHAQFTVEGAKSVTDALASDMHVAIVAMSVDFAADNADICDCTEQSGTKLYTVENAIFGGLCDTETPQGMLCVIDMPAASAVLGINTADDTANIRGGMYVYCDRIADPGNMGTIIRTAAAAGASGVILSAGCVDLYSPKTVRSTMGAFFSIPIYTDTNADMLNRFKQQGHRILAGALTDTAKDYRDADFSGDIVIVVGNESNGVCDDILSLVDEIVKIPISDGVESLNASVAAAIMMYEWRRNRI